MLAVEAFEKNGVRGFLHTPQDATGCGLILTHGAGANCQAPLLLQLAGAFQTDGWFVLRCDLPFRQARPHGPPHPSQAARDREGLRAAAIEMRSLGAGPVVLGGHSYGGRQASMLLSEQPEAAQALLLLSYPLHPPKQPAQLRTAHWPALNTPSLFVHGTADPFGSVSEMEEAFLSLPARRCLSVVESAGHGLNRGKFDTERLVVDPLRGILNT